MYGWSNQGMDGGWWILMMMGMVLFWGLLVVGLVTMWRHQHPTSASHPLPGHIPTSPTVSASSSAILILQERFARGEISEEEYARRLAVLKDQA